VLIFNTGILLHLGKKAAPFLDPGLPSGLARRGQSPPGDACSHAGEPHRSPGRARLALEKLSQSLSLKGRTEYHGQPFR